MSKSREMDTLADSASPLDLAKTATKLGCASVAFTYNDPLVFLEYAVDVARACREQDVRTVAVTAGYVTEQPRADFFSHIDAANVDLKAFTERFYRNICGGSLKPVLDTLVYLKDKTDVWLELTTLIIPGENDSDEEIDRMTRWVVGQLGHDVPMHFTAFHPDWKMMEPPPTPASTLTRARRIAMDNGIRYAYTGNVHDPDGGSTYCHQCGARLIERDWYRIGEWKLDGQACCLRCRTRVAGVIEGPAGNWGAKRMPVHSSGPA